MNMKTRNQTNIPYEYHHAPVPGGGFVTGFCFHPNEMNILYARTDIGGAYRYDFATSTWISLMDHVKSIEKWESYPLSIAIDPANPDWLYIAAGDWKNNYICRSKDRGESFEYFPIPAGIHGNSPGRGTGERLIVDPSNPAIIYFGSQADGLLLSEDYGETWNRLPVQAYDRKEELDIAFVWIDPRTVREGRCQTLVISTSGKENSSSENVIGESLYISKDAGKSFLAMPGQQKITDLGNYSGFVGQRAVLADSYLFVTMSAAEISRQGWRSGYGCDRGGVQNGCIIRYELSEQGEVTNYKYVTPDMSFMVGSNRGVSNKINDISIICGFGGINAVNGHPNQLICSTQNSGRGEAVLYSRDAGESWTPILYNLEIGKMDFTEVPYMKPQYNGNRNLIHWLSDIKIDPFNSNRALFNTGTGIFMTENLQDCNVALDITGTISSAGSAEGTTVEATVSGKDVIWKPSCKGLEETVHLNVYSPPAGEVKLIDIIGDLGGFAFTDLNKPCENSFADNHGNRYITCLNADFPDNNPMLVAVTARGNWSGQTTGGLIWSENQCKTWRRLPDPVGITDRIDSLIKAIRRANTNSGWTAISADAKTLVWTVGERYLLPIDSIVYTEDLGYTWNKCKVFDRDNKRIDDIENTNKTLKVLSDRVDPEMFYGFGNDSSFYISTDRARSFHEINVPEEFPQLELGGMDGKMPAEIRAESDRLGVVWIATGDEGLWRITFNKTSRDARFERVSKATDKIYRQGMGKEAEGSPYKTIYVNGIIDGEYGFYRSFDEGKSWQRINNERQMFGDIRSITGDPRVFGRFYIATGSRGVLWGQPIK